MSEAFLESTDDSQNAYKYDACPPNAKKIKCCNKIEQQNCFKNCSKSRIEKKMLNLTVGKIWITCSMSLKTSIFLTGFQL